jgi:hypothetical protein
MTPPPDPPTERTAVLASEGYQQREGQPPRFTRHTYVDVVQSKDHVGKPGWAQRWRCSVTGAVRTWGFYGNRHDSEDDGDNDQEPEADPEPELEECMGECGREYPPDQLDEVGCCLVDGGCSVLAGPSVQINQRQGER